MHVRTISRFTARFMAAALVALGVAACEHNPAEPGVLASITVTPSPQTLSVGTTQQFVAIGADANGTVVGINPAWSMTASGGTVNGSGVVTAGAVVGTYASTVTATVGSISGKATLIVISGGPATVVVTPNPVTLAIGAPQPFTAVFKDAGGNVVVGTPTWAVVQGGGTISSAGLFTAGTVSGTFTNTVTASMGVITGSATVIVTPGALATIVVTPNPSILAVNGVQPFVATGKDSHGNTVLFTPTWSVQALGGVINSSTGVFTAGLVSGTFINTVRACSTALCAAGSISGSATVTVSSGALFSITVTPNPVDVGTLATQPFVAIGRDVNGNVVPILPPVTWSVLPGYAGGTILPGGGYIAPNAVGVGLDTVRATSGAIFGSARVNVKASSALVSVVVTPNPANLLVNGLQTFTATGFDGAGLIVPTPGLVWSVVAGGGSIDNTGLFTAGAVIGVFPNTVRATSGALFGSATVNVSAAAFVGVALGSAASHGILAGATVTCADGTSVINGDVSVAPGTNIDAVCVVPLPHAKHFNDVFAQNAQNDAQTAWLALQGMICPAANTIGIADLNTHLGPVGVGSYGPGVYCSGSTLSATGEITLDGGGNNNALFVFQAGSSLTTHGSIKLQNGAQAKNVFWWNAASASLDNAFPLSSTWQGTIVSFTSITLETNITLIGRALALNGTVALNGINNTITLP